MAERHNLARGADEWSDTYGSLGMAAPAQQARLPLHVLDPWKNAEGKPQPFKPYTAEKLEELADSIRKNGVIEPICVRPMPGGRFQIIAGHNRVEASKLAGLPDIPALIRQLDDDQAAILMADSNLQHRETLFPSEKAFAYLEKMRALKRQGQRSDLTSSPVGTKLRSADEMALETGDSRNQIHRYIRLTGLLPYLLDLVDSNKLSVRAGVELSYLQETEQQFLLQVMEEMKAKPPSMKQAKELRAKAEIKQLLRYDIWAIMAGKPNTKLPKAVTVKLPATRISSFFPQNTPPEQMEEEIYQALMAYRKNNQTPASTDVGVSS